MRMPRHKLGLLMIALGSGLGSACVADGERALEGEPALGDGPCRWSAPGCSLPPLGPEPSGVLTQHPIVLAHGFDASSDNDWAFYQVAEELREHGLGEPTGSPTRFRHIG